MTQNTFETPAVHEQVIVLEIPQASQVVDSFLSFRRVFLHPCATKSFRNNSLRQYGHMFLFKIFKCSRLWSGYRNKIVEPIDVLSLAVTYAPPSQQLLSIMKIVTTGVNLDHHRVGEPAIFYSCCGGFCATGPWFTFPLQEFEQHFMRNCVAHTSTEIDVSERSALGGFRVQTCFFKSVNSVLVDLTTKSTKN